jgi:amino acid transporter
MLPEFLGKIHPRHQTPHIALCVFLIIAVALILGVGLLGKVAPMDYFGFAGTLGAIPIILTYMLTNLALPIYVIGHRRSELNFIRHVLLPIVGTLIMLFPLWGLIQPGQPWPFNIFPRIALGALGVSVIYGIVVARLSPGLAARIGVYVADQ